MHSSSVEEYKLLKKELSEIKECINKYIGYIIGSNGLVFILVSVLGTNLIQKESVNLASTANQGLTALILLLTGWIVLVTLYSIITYKLNSHNRHVGYMHVLVQENDFLEMNFKSNYHPLKWISKKIQRPDIEAKVDISSIILWEYVMTRWNSKNTPKSYPKFAYDKLDLKYETGKYKIDDILIDNPGSIEKDNIYQAFNKYIIWNQCQTSTILKLIRKRFFQPRIYEKYKLSSWGYPSRLGSLICSLYLILGIAIGLACSFVQSPFDVTTNYLIAVTFYCSYLFILFRGVHTHLRLQKGDMTTDYYCWAFLIFRVQYLNHHDIRPVYFSTSFIRYIKSLQISEYIKKLSIVEFCDDTNFFLKEKQHKMSPEKLKTHLVYCIERGLKIDEIYKPYLKQIRNRVLSIEELCK